MIFRVDGIAITAGVVSLRIGSPIDKSGLVLGGLEGRETAHGKAVNDEAEYISQPPWLTPAVARGGRYQTEIPIYHLSVGFVHGRESPR